MKHIIVALILTAVATATYADRLVILHTNDTHSQIDPTDKDLGGVIRRKALIDSVRAVEPNVLLIDGGDAVQGTLFFSLFGGEVEHKVLNHLGYDMAIVGNHDFDNGVDALARNLAADTSVEWIATNYDLKDSSIGKSFVPYVVKQYGGRRIAFIGINLNPKGMIAEGNYDGVKYYDALKAANSTAWHLKHNEGIDMVVAISHLGYDIDPRPNDLTLATMSEDIDMIIGGHSHTKLVDGHDLTRVDNLDGKKVIIAQAGSRGEYVGEITVDLDELTARSRLIPVNSRLDRYVPDQELVAMIQPYRHAIDSIMGIKIGRSAVELTKPRLLNLFADMVYTRGKMLAPDVDFSIINKGGIRRELPKGDITVGMIMTTLPFNNHVAVLDLTGADIVEALNVMASRGGDGIGGDIKVTVGDATPTVESVMIGGKPLDPEAVYRVATIDYLAGGGDYMQSLTNGSVVARSPQVLYDDIIDQIKSTRKPLTASPTPRM